MSSTEAVDHPKHYNALGAPCPGCGRDIECIDVIRHMLHNRGAAVKYVWRAGEKDPAKEIEDLQKAIWYLRDEIARIAAAEQAR